MKVGSGSVANGKKHQGRSDSPLSRAAAGYRPQRQPKLRGFTGDGAAPGNGPDTAYMHSDLDAALEDGLRILAALESASSLEPDYTEELAPEEASITVIEQAQETGDAGSLQARLERICEALETMPERPRRTSFGGAEEATIEIFELEKVASDVEEALAHYRHLKRTADGER